MTSTSNNVRWGIIGSGKICSDFVNALKTVDGAVVEAIGSSSLDKSNAFADMHGISKRYGSYAELAADSAVDIIYVGTIHTLHKEHAILALNGDKHVLVEKPMGVNVQETEEIIRVAKDKKLFLMEGMWTRFFPSVRKARKLIEEGAIGEVVHVSSDFGSEFPPDLQRAHDPALAGGGLLDIGIYPLATVPIAFGATPPTTIAAAGALSETGVDCLAGVSLAFGRRGLATVHCNIKAFTAEETIFSGTGGRIRLHSPAHAPLKLTLTTLKQAEACNDDGTPKGGADIYESSEEVMSFDLPPPAAGCTGFIFPHSQGFSYEAAAVQKCVLEGLTECPEYTLEETLWVARVIEESRRQIGYKLPMESQE